MIKCQIYKPVVPVFEQVCNSDIFSAFSFLHHIECKLSYCKWLTVCGFVCWNTYQMICIGMGKILADIFATKSVKENQGQHMCISWWWVSLLAHGQGRT